MTYHLAYPDILTVKNSADFSQRLKLVPACAHYVLDFSNLTVAYPFATLLALASTRAFVLSAVRAAEEQGGKVCFKASGINIVKNSAHSYLAHIGFFQELGINVGKYSGEALGSQGYVPIRHIKRTEVLSEAAKTSKHYGEVLIKKAEDLSVVVTKALKPNSTDVQSEYIFKVVSYTIREILRNSIEHSESPDIVVSGQSYPKSGGVEIAILDYGIGIHNSLAERYGYSHPTESIVGALVPGVSSKLHLNQRGEWGNSGFGLYATKRMCTLFPDDKFAVASSGVLYSAYNKDAVSILRGLSHTGTAVMLKLSRNDEYYFEPLLAQIVDEGEAEAEIRTPGARASKMSKVLKLGNN